MAEREVVAVTGPRAGWGGAIAREFARHGAAIGLIARGRTGLDAAARTSLSSAGTVVDIADVAEFGQVAAAADAIERRHGSIDVWINNAMTTVFDFFDDISPDEYERATRVTYLGAVWGTKAALERMLPRDGGTVVTAGWQPTSAHVGPFDEVAVIGYPYASALLRADIPTARTWSSVSCDISDGIPAAEASRRKDHDTKTGWRGLSGDDPSQSEVFEGDEPG